MRKLIQSKLDELGLSMKEASLKIGRNHAYLHQFLKKSMPAELGEYERARLSQILGVPESELKGPSPNLPKRDYVKLIEPVTHTQRYTKTSEVGQNAVDIVSSSGQMFGDRDLPVFGTAQRGRGDTLIMTNEAVDWTVRPAPLLRVRDGYGMIVTGDSMSPKIENGSTALVNPHLPPRNGDTCVFRRKLDDGSLEAVIRTLVSFTDDTWSVNQKHPKRDYAMKRSEWPTCHVIIGNYFVR